MEVHMYIIVFKQHGALHCETQYFGPYADFDTAYDAMCECRIPPLYSLEQREELGIGRDDGYRFLQELSPAKGALSCASLSV
jgi:hypothetical protein